MSDQQRLCQAVTKAGTPCKNAARAGSAFCYVHRSQEAAAAAPATSPAAAINELAAEIKQTAPAYQPPPYSPQALLALVQETVHRITGDIRLPLVEELMNNLKGTKPEDLVDPETWKGLWYILNYTAQAQSKQALDAALEQLAKLPGGETLLLVKSTVESASPKDLLDINTWKGALVIANAAMQAQANEVKRRVLGQQDE